MKEYLGLKSVYDKLKEYEKCREEEKDSILPETRELARCLMSHIAPMLTDILLLQERVEALEQRQNPSVHNPLSTDLGSWDKAVIQTRTHYSVGDTLPNHELPLEVIVSRKNPDYSSVASSVLQPSIPQM
jgi:hypothetical protein